MAVDEYPVSYDVDRPEAYNRWTVLFRPILAIPHLILVGGGAYAVGWSQSRLDDEGGLWNLTSTGILGTVLTVLVIFAWFAIMFTGRFPRSMREFCELIFRWQQNVQAYVTLQAAPYPPFGRGEYPLRLRVAMAEHYNRWTVFFRLFLVIPHAIVLLFLTIAQFVVTVIAWFAILITGAYPEGMHGFSVGVSRWSARVGAYMALFVDEYPPFTLSATTTTGATGGLTPHPA